eukprot:Rmarinus@m.19677
MKKSHKHQEKYTHPYPGPGMYETRSKLGTAFPPYRPPTKLVVQKEPYNSPGPGQYDHPSTLQKQLGKCGKAERATMGPNSNYPGPGRYEYINTVGKVAPFRFGKGERPALSHPTTTPGPQYSVVPAFNQEATRLPAWRFGSEKQRPRHHAAGGDSVGPIYDVSAHCISKRESPAFQALRQPNFSFGKEERLVGVKRESKIPGPGTYKVCMDAPRYQWKIGSEKRDRVHGIKEYAVREMIEKEVRLCGERQARAAPRRSRKRPESAKPRLQNTQANEEDEDALRHVPLEQKLSEFLRMSIFAGSHTERNWTTESREAWV